MSGRCCLISGMAARRSCWANRPCGSSWQARERRLVLDANLSAREIEAPSDRRTASFWRCGEAEATLGPWSVRWAIEPA